METGGRTKVTLATAFAAMALLMLATPSEGQILPLPPWTTTTSPGEPSSTTTTTSDHPSSTTTTAGSLGPTSTTAPPAGSGGSPPPPPPGPEAGDGDEGNPAPPPGSRVGVPPEAQRIMDSVQRTPASSSADLLAGVEQLVELGLSRDEAIRIGFGRFPIAGKANYSHDWLFPRYGPGFRFHLGTDVFAEYGTPLRSPMEGIVRSGNGSLGGLYVKIHMDDGTYFYFAHMSGLVEGFTEGMRVETGDIVGYVGDSGNAKGTPPHLHIGIYPEGGAATDPKPILDQWLAEAIARLPEVVEQVRADRPVTGGDSPVAEVPTTPRSLLATSLLRPLTQRTAAEVPTEVLYQTTGNPSAGGVSVAQAQAEQLAASIDWADRAARLEARDELVARTEEALRTAFGPLLRRAGDDLAAG